LLVVEDDPERRIAELERQLAQQKRIAELERELARARAAAGADQPGRDSAAADHNAQSLLDGLRSDDPSAPDLANLREALKRAAGDAGMSQEQLDNALRNAHVTVNSSRSVVYPGMDSHATIRRRSMFVTRPRRGGSTVGGLVGALAGLFGICVGGAAALTALFPATALWASPIVCRSPYHLDYRSSSYSYRPGQSGTSISFRCVNGDAWYRVNELLLTVLQCLLVGLVVAGIVTAIWLIRRQVRRPGM
jgi:hypothetical protein